MRSIVIFCSLVIGLACWAWTEAESARPTAAASVAVASERVIEVSCGWRPKRAARRLTRATAQTLQCKDAVHRLDERLAPRIGLRHGGMKLRVLALYPRSEQSRLLRSLHIPGVGRDERYPRGRDACGLRGVQVHRPVRLPALPLVDRDHALDEVLQAGACEELVGALGTAVR